MRAWLLCGRIGRMQVVILVTGKMPSGLQALVVKLHRYIIRMNAYLLLMTDRYPAWN